MPNKPPRMRLSPEEQAFLGRWMYDELHYQGEPGPAKQLQIVHGAVPADLGALIAAAIPDPLDQEAAALAVPQDFTPSWPWPSSAIYRERLEEAIRLLVLRGPGNGGRPEKNQVTQKR
jgi:hypothetical protein